MDNLDAISLTKGCFVHKPTKIKRKKLCNKPISTLSPLKDIKQSLWDEINTKIKQIEERSYLETFDGVVQFIKSCFTVPLQEVDEVPTAVLVMGVNMSDHSNLFNLLEQHLHSNGIYATVVLRSKKCSNMSTMLQVIVYEILNKWKDCMKRIMDKSLIFNDELPKKQECSFAKLQHYLDQVSEKAASPIKKKDQINLTKFKSISNSIVLLIQDVENFNTELLQELILLCKIYSGKLPIVLIFGMASAMVTLHNILPQKALCCLGVETFYSVPATEYLSRIIEEVIICPEQPFKLDHRVFRLIVDTVLYHDFSVSNLSYLLKFVMLEHLYGRKFISLCCHESDIEKQVNELHNEDLQAIKLLPSLKLYQDNNPSFASCANDPTTLKKSIIGFLKNIFHYQRISLVLLKLLHCFSKDLPGYPLGKHLRELYALSLQKEICTANAFIEAQKLLKMQSQQSLIQKLEACINILKESNCKGALMESTEKMLESSVEKLKNLAIDDFEKNVQDPLSLQSEKIISRFQLQEKIQISIKQKRSNFEGMRNEIIDSLLQIFKNIIPPTNHPLYEIFYFDDISSVKKCLMAVPRVTSCYSLNNPQCYLKCNCCKIEQSEETVLSMPDVSILYKLHLESGKLINLHDWLEAFKVIKSNGENVNKRSQMKNKSRDDELNIRFLQAVSELQMLGFIKPTKRKTDHVARLTFGSF